MTDMDIKKERRFAFRVDSDILRMVIVTIVIFAAMALMNPKFLRVSSFVSMGYQLPELGFYSLAMMMVMLTGGRDLSVVGIGNFAGIIAAMIMHDGYERGLAGGALFVNILLGVLAAIALGVVCGAINGFVISRFRVPAMLLTMATNYIYTGISIVLTNAEAVAKVPDPFVYLGNNQFWGIPIPMWFLVAALVVTGFILNWTRFGFEVRMVGSNARASHYSGMNNKRILMKTYIYSGVMCAICGLIILSRTNTAKADYAITYTFQAILCAVLGATAPNGGFAKISCMTLSLMSLQFLSSGFNLLRLGGYFKEFAWGLLLVVVLSVNFFVDAYRRKKSVKAMGRRARLDRQKAAT